MSEMLTKLCDEGKARNSGLKLSLEEDDNEGRVSWENYFIQEMERIKGLNDFRWSHLGPDGRIWTWSN